MRLHARLGKTLEVLHLPVKIKLVYSFYQIATKVPSIYKVELPDSGGKVPESSTL